MTVTPNFGSRRILVTGGAGFIGSAVVWALNQRRISNVLITDVLHTDQKWKNLLPLRFADYIDAIDFLARLTAHPEDFRDIGTVFHLGACSSTLETNAAYLMRNNFEYTKELCAWALAHDARFVYASSAATYGTGAAGMSDRVESLEQLRPLNAYGYSKHLFDLYAWRHQVLDRIVGLKYFNVFGPNENHKGEMRSMVNKAYEQIVATGSVRLFKSHHPAYQDGEQRRDFLYVKDAVTMTLHLAESQQARGLFNLGSGIASTWLDLVAPIFRALARPQRVEFIDLPEALRATYQYCTQADTSKLRATGYTQSATSLSDAVTDYVTQYLTTDKRLGD